MPCDDRSFPVSEIGQSAPNLPQLLAILIVGVLRLLVAAAWVAMTAVRTRRWVGRAAAENMLTVDRPFSVEGRFAGDPYVGLKACAPYHPGESALHARSGHATTLLPARRLELSPRLDGISLEDPERPGVRWAYHLEQDWQVPAHMRDRTAVHESDVAFE
jgi:hypothetical protein